VSLAVMFVASSAAAQTSANQSPATPAAEKQPSIYDDIWSSFTEIYDDKSNPVIQRVLFSGRFQHDFALVDADDGEHRESNLRRLRLGPRITLFRQWLFHAEVELNPQERNPFYVRFTDLYVQWSKNGRLAITGGKQSVPFTIEGATSSKELLTIDRSNLANNIWFPQEYMPGVSVSGRPGPWIYRAGVYSRAQPIESWASSAAAHSCSACSATTSRRISTWARPCSPATTSISVRMKTTRSRAVSSTSCRSISNSTSPIGDCARTCRWRQAIRGKAIWSA
jgi:phosphate-selective porin